MAILAANSVYNSQNKKGNKIREEFFADSVVSKKKVHQVQQQHGLQHGGAVAWVGNPLEVKMPPCTSGRNCYSCKKILGSNHHAFISFSHEPD